MAYSPSDYVVYVDESGDPGLGESIKPKYPVLCLAFCIFKKQEYCEKIVPAFSKLKSRYCGHDRIVLHEKDMRKRGSKKYPFLNDWKTRQMFFDDLNKFVEKSAFHVTASVIHKPRYSLTANPYELAVFFCMERLLEWLLSKGEAHKTIDVIFESGADGQSDKIELEFESIIRGDTSLPVDARHDFDQIDFTPRFRKKQDNDAGLQMADLIAYPIGRNAMGPQDPDRRSPIIKYEIIEKKYIKEGLNIFPLKT